MKQVKEPKIRVIRGKLCSKVQILLDLPIKIEHEVSLVTNSKFININNEFHLVKGSFGNKELLLRIETEIENGETFYTDLNGFQVNNQVLITIHDQLNLFRCQSVEGIARYRFKETCIQLLH